MPSPALVIIPARRGSEGVPGKHTRLLGDKPTISHIIQTCREVPNADLVVSTNDPAVAQVARFNGVRVHNRTESTSDPDAPLDVVVTEVLRDLDPNDHYDVVATVQSTSPFLRAETITECLAKCLDPSTLVDTCLTVRDARALQWSGSLESLTRPAALVNRHLLAPSWKQTGGCVASRRSVIGNESRYGSFCYGVLVRGAEAVDIDTEEDWVVAKDYANHATIAYRVDGSHVMGMGHIYRAMMLVDAIPGHEITFYSNETKHPEGVAVLRGRGYRVESVRELMDSPIPDIFISEGRDTTVEEVKAFKAGGAFVVTIEDRGPGSAAADLTFNDLDGPPLNGPRRFQGPRYAMLRDEFLPVAPRHKAHDLVLDILVTFGGSYPGRLTEKTLQALESVQGAFDIHVVRGVASGRVSTKDHRVILHDDVDNMAELMARADLAITSCGRTVLELIRCQTPTIAMAQNAHEMKHESAHWQYGVTNLGYGPDFDPQQIALSVEGMLPRQERQRSLAFMQSVTMDRGVNFFWDTVFHVWKYGGNQ
jgi:spore coat polysaccharide biosynthesis predicted glycosyltransferase SpsG/molybdopterin-guanine dinucleotide biosynthesis protein A